MVMALFSISQSAFASSSLPNPNDDGDIQFRIAGEPDPFVANFERLRELEGGNRKEYDLKCSKSLGATSTFNAPIFNDDKFESKYRNDDILETLKLYLYFNEASDLVPDELLPEFIEFTQHFYILYKLKLIGSPNLILDLEHSNEILDFASDNSEVKYRKTHSRSLQTSLDFVKSHDRVVDEKRFGARTYSSSLLLLFSKIATYDRHCQMSLEEDIALRIYTGMGFKKLNTYLRNSNAARNQRFDELVLLTNRALDKIENSRGFVFRTTRFLTQPDLPESVYRQHTIGNIVEYKAYTSTAITPIQNTNLLIYSRTGKHICDYSLENEVLFRPGTKFKVLYNSCELSALTLWQGCRIILDEVSEVESLK